MNTSNAPHSSMTKVYLAVFGGLAVLTAITVGASYLHLPRPGAIALGVFIASLKVALIVAFFMHMRSEGKIIRWLLTAALLLVLFLLFMILPDIGWSCTVCFGEAGADWRRGFYWGILLLLLLPLTIVSVIAYKIISSIRRKHENSGHPADLPGTPR